MIDGRTLVYDALMRSIPPGSRTGSGWVKYNGPCCMHRGQGRPDTKKRSGILFDYDGRTSVSCFNCGLRLSWSPGSPFGSKWENYFKWLGMPAEKLMRLHFTVAELRKEMLANGQLNLETALPSINPMPTFDERVLPKGAMPVSMWLEEGCEDPAFIEAVSYLAGRGDEILLGNEYYWTPETTSGWNNRIIIPFFWEGEIVGYTGRLVNGGEGRRYMSDTQPHYIFNTEKIKTDWQYLFITEGPFDAIAVNGAAMLGDKSTAEQIAWVNRSGKVPIVVPDRTNQGGKLVDTALTEGWHVSFPSWDDGIKDAADAVLAYGKLYAVWSIIDARTKNRLEIGVKRQRLK